MDLVTLDLETYFDVEYSVKRMTTEEYIRDRRFKIHCVGWKVNNEPTRTSRKISDLPDLSNCAVLCHHAHFDLLALSHHYGIRPKFILDTISMARLAYPHAAGFSLEALAVQLQSLGPKTVPYQLFQGKQELDDETYNLVAGGCAHDIDLTHDIFKKLLPKVPAEELKVIDLTIRMFTEPTLTLDRARLQNYLTQTKAEKEKLLKDLQVSRADLQSSEKFAGLLRDMGVEPPIKASPSNPEKEVYAFAKTDDGFKALLEHDNEHIQMLAAARAGQKSTIGETRAQRLIDMDTRGALPVYLNYCGAHTTRWSGGGKMNWQNFPKKGDIRTSITAPPGYVLVVGDCSQIECRLVNWLAGQNDILEAFRAGRDLYSEEATRFYGRPITKADKQERHLGKTIELGCGFGMGDKKFQATCRQGALGGAPIILNIDEAKRAVLSYRSSHPRVEALWKYANTVLKHLYAGTYDYEWGPMRVVGKRIQLPNGAYLDYSNLCYDENGFYTSSRRGKAKMYGAKLVENVVQALARVILSQAMLKVSDRYRIVLCTHDDMVALVPEAQAEAATNWLLNMLKTPPAWCLGVPLDAEGGYAREYSK